MSDRLHTDPDVVGAARERTVFFEAEGSQLFGIVGEPAEPNGHGVLIIQGGDTVNVSLMRNRMAVNIARRLVAAGYHTLRFDYHGLGESSGVLGELRLSSPFAPDAIAAAECLRRETGIGPMFLYGACFSARTALSAAPSIENVAGIVMSTPPSASFERIEGTAQRMARERTVTDYASRAVKLSTLKSLADPDIRRMYIRLLKAKVRQVFLSAKSKRSGDPYYWVSEHFLNPLDEMVDRNVPMYIAFGVEDPELREFERAEGGRLGAIIGRANGLIDVARDLPGVIHGFVRIDGQNAFIEQSIDWIRNHTPDQD